MRSKERIPIFFKLVNLAEVEELFNAPAGSIELCNIASLALEWYDNHDLRFGQLLINKGYIPDSVKAWHIEESDILKSQGVDPAEYTLWGHIGNSKEEHDKLLSDWQNGYEKFGLNQSDLNKCGQFVTERAEAMDRGDNLSTISKDNLRKLNAFYAWNQSAPKPTYSPIRQLETSHLEAILDMTGVAEEIVKVIGDELNKRKC